MKPLFILLAMVSILAASCKSNTAEDSSSTSATDTGGTPKGVAYQVDVPRSEVKWSAFKPTGTHQGVVPLIGGTVYIHEGNLSGGAIEINMSALEVRDLEGEWKEKLESHLKGTAPGKEDDFFNVNKYPTATYTISHSTKLENDPVGTHMVHGHLRIKEITRPVNFKATMDLANANAIKATTEPFVIDRTEWGIKFQSKKFFNDLQDDFIHDEVKLEIVLGAIASGGK